MGDAGVAANPEQILLTAGAARRWTSPCATWCSAAIRCWWTNPAITTCSSTCACKVRNCSACRAAPTGWTSTAWSNWPASTGPRSISPRRACRAPTGGSLSLAAAHRLLQLAERYDFLIVENDIYADLDPAGQMLLANLDQLARVIYIGSLSKVIAPALRTGFIAAHPELIEELVPLKMVSGLTSSELTETLALDVLLQGRHRKHVRQLRDQLGEATTAWRGAWKRPAWKSSTNPAPGCSSGPGTARWTMPPCSPAAPRK